MNLFDYLEACGWINFDQHCSFVLSYHPGKFITNKLTAEETHALLNCLNDDLYATQTWLYGALNRSDMLLKYYFGAADPRILTIFADKSWRIPVQSCKALDYMYSVRRRRTRAYASLLSLTRLPPDVVDVIVWGYC
jgi:hypothetical protein